MKKFYALFGKDQREEKILAFSFHKNLNFKPEAEPERVLFHTFRTLKRYSVTGEKYILSGRKDFYSYRISDVTTQAKRKTQEHGTVMICSEIFLIPDFYFDKTILEEMKSFFPEKFKVLLQTYTNMEIESNGNYLLFFNPTGLFKDEDLSELMDLAEMFMDTVFKNYPGNRRFLKNIN